MQHGKIVLAGSRAQRLAPPEMRAAHREAGSAS